MKIASTRISDIVKYFREQLKGIYDPGEIEVFIHLCFETFLNFDKTKLLLKLKENVSESELLRFSFAVKELKLQRPIQYILGQTDFYQLKFFVNENVLIPRPETEELVDLIIKDNKDKEQLTILDVGTGSGCIAIALKKNLPQANVVALDISEAALMLAKKNALFNGVMLSFIKQDILEEAPFFSNADAYDCIVSNPPYVCFSERMEMQKNVLEHEPHLALFVPDEDPLLFYKKIGDYALKHLNQGGKLYFEVNASYGLETREMLKQKGLTNLILLNDLNNKNRILRGAI